MMLYSVMQVLQGSRKELMRGDLSLTNFPCNNDARRDRRRG